MRNGAGRVSLRYCLGKMKDIRLVIFDLDGTLIDAYAAIIASFNYTMRSLKFPAQSALVVRRAVGWGDRNLLRPFVKEEDLARAMAIYRGHHRKSLLKGARLFPGARRTLNYLKNKGYLLAIASNRPTEFSGIILRHLGLRKYFKYMLCADRLKHGKPHPEILRKIMQKFSCQPKATLYIGDMAIDAQAGRRAKVKTIMVATGSNSRSQLQRERPYRIISRLLDLLKIL